MKVRFSAWGSSSSEKGNTYKILEHYIRNEIDGDSPSSTLIWCDLAFTLVALIACIEITVLCLLALKQHACRIYDLDLQRWALRVMLIAPVYSWLIWSSLRVSRSYGNRRRLNTCDRRWEPKLAYWVEVPVGCYEGVAIFAFFSLLVSFTGGEDKVVMALGTGAERRSGAPGRAARACAVYHPCTLATCCGRRSEAARSWVEVPMLKFHEPKTLYRFLKSCVSQFVVVKPLNAVALAALSDSVDSAHLLAARIITAASLVLVAQALMQLYIVALPRIRGMGGEKLFSLLQLVIVVIIAQELVITVLLLDSDATSSTILASTRFVYALTIVELTVFTTIFYRLLPPNRFAAIAARYGETPMVPATRASHAAADVSGGRRDSDPPLPDERPPARDAEAPADEAPTPGSYRTMSTCALLGAVLDPRDVFALRAAPPPLATPDIDADVRAALDRPPSLLDIADLHPAVEKNDKAPCHYAPNGEETPLI